MNDLSTYREIWRELEGLRRQIDRLANPETPGNPISYTPTWTAASTNPSLGNGTITGMYILRAGYVKYQLKLLWGTTTTGGSGAWIFTLPFSALATPDLTFFGALHLYDASTGTRHVRQAGIGPASTTFRYSFVDGSATIDTSTTYPFTWASGDQYFLDIEYRKA